MAAVKWGKVLLPLLAIVALATVPANAQSGTQDGEWRYYAGDPGSTKYAPLDQINAENAANLRIAWQWKSENFGERPEYNWEVTPLMIDGVLYITAGSRRDAVAVDAATGETLWMYRLDEGERGARAPRSHNRGLAYWSDGQGDDRILLISPGYQLVGLNAKTGRPIESFGNDGVVELFEGLDRDPVELGTIGSTSPAIVISDVIVLGSAQRPGGSPPSKANTPGYIRGYDVRTGERLWTFRTIPQPGEFGHETWENNSWEYTGNGGAWATLSGDPELGYVYIPTETATGDFYGGTRHGDNLFTDSIVCLDAKTGERVWHYQLVHHDIWDFDTASPPILLDVTVDGRTVKAVAQPSKQGWLYVFDRVTGEPVWPVEERPVAQTTIPSEKTAPTQPFPTKPAPFERQGVSEDDLIDFTPELRAEALEIAKEYKLGPIYTPPIMVDEGGLLGTLVLPNAQGGANWPGGAADPETGIVYVSSVTDTSVMALVEAAPERSDMGLIAGRARREGPRPPRGQRMNIGPDGLPLIKPPWGRITAIDLNTGDHVWMKANGEAPEYVQSHPRMQGIDLNNTGRPERALLMVTKTLLVSGDGGGLFTGAPGGGDNKLRFLDKATGETIHVMELPANTTGVPMSYMVDGKQYIAFPVGGRGYPAELIAVALP